jgi:carboxyl-terminal processing protease
MDDMKKRFSTFSVFVLCVGALLLGMVLDTVISGDNIYEQITKFKDVLSYVEKNYVEEVDTPKLTESAINGLLETLDPHSVYIPVSNVAAANEPFQGSFEGIGVEFDVMNDTILVVSPISGGPSEALGILAGDKIVKIDDTTSVGIKREDVPKKLRGPKGTRVKVAIARGGEKDLIDFDIVRDKIPIYSVDVSYMVDPEIGYIRVNRFGQNTHTEVVNAVARLKGEGMKKLILDLRDNPGGYLDQAFKMSDEMLPKGRRVVYTKGRRPEFNDEYISTGSGKLIDVPLIVLVNHGSASASEIVSGAVQDWDRGLIVGETTFGKGLVQRPFSLADRSELRLTIARYYTPSGRLIQRPYDKDRAEYRHGVVDDSLEGDNLEHVVENDSGRPVFKTLVNGRNVLGGGGITPDYIVKAEKITQYTVDLLRKNVFLDFITKYMDRNGKEIRHTYESSLPKFRSDFSISDDILKEFTSLAEKKGVPMNDEQYKKDLTYLRARLKAQIARNIWGNDGWFPVILGEDNQFQKAMTLFPEAKKLANLQ